MRNGSRGIPRFSLGIMESIAYMVPFSVFRTSSSSSLSLLLFCILYLRGYATPVTPQSIRNTAAANVLLNIRSSGLSRLTQNGERLLADAVLVHLFYPFSAYSCIYSNMAFGRSADAPRKMEPIRMGLTIMPSLPWLFRGLTAVVRLPRSSACRPPM